MTTPLTDQRPDINEMRVIHRVFRREFARLPEMIRATPAGDTARAAIVADHAARMVLFLSVHHQGEDELIWPLLSERTTPRAEVVSRMAAQHGIVAQLIERAREQLGVWPATASASARDELAATLDALYPPLVAHLDEEEREVLPLIADHLSQGEWARLAEHGRASVGPVEGALVLGAILEEATSEERERMLASMPPPAREGWISRGQPAYGVYIERVRQTS